MCIFIIIHTHACIYFRKIGYVYILKISIYNIHSMNINIDMQIHVNIIKIYTVCVCIYVYIINKHRTHTYYANKTFILYAIKCD